MSRRKNRVSYFVVPDSKVYHRKEDCPALLQKVKPEKIGSMEIGCRGLKACACAGGVAVEEDNEENS